MKERRYISLNCGNSGYEGITVTDQNDTVILELNTGNFDQDYDLVTTILKTMKAMKDFAVLRSTTIDNYLKTIN